MADVLHTLLNAASLVGVAFFVVVLAPAMARDVRTWRDPEEAA